MLFVHPGELRRAEWYEIKPMSENTVNAALRRLGYDRSMITAHGFRGMASTLLHECGGPSDVIERQLSHAERDAVKAAYNHAEHLPMRRKMMQVWADHPDALRTGGPIVSNAA
jgi:integrase